MERHAALGPIVWTDGGMRATTRDGYSAEIRSLALDSRGRWIVKVCEPRDIKGMVHSWSAPFPTLCEARAGVAVLIGHLRDRQERRREAVADAFAMMSAVMARCPGQKPPPAGGAPRAEE